MSEKELRNINKIVAALQHMIEKQLPLETSPEVHQRCPPLQLYLRQA